VVAAIHGMQRGPVAQPPCQRLDEIPSRQGVPRPLEEQHRNPDPFEMLVPDSFRPPRRVQRIAHEDQADCGKSVGDQQRGDPATEGLAPGEEG
jgi:hypothetical protein